MAPQFPNQNLKYAIDLAPYQIWAPIKTMTSPNSPKSLPDFHNFSYAIRREKLDLNTLD